MEVTFADIFNVISLLLGGGGLGYFFSWRYNRRKEKAEVELEVVEKTENANLYSDSIINGKVCVVFSSADANYIVLKTK